MPAKIRLARRGKKKNPFYHIVIADSRAPRNGKFIEQLGIYNPNTDPATIELDFDKTLSWLQQGAQPTDTCKAILSYKGILYKHHLLNGVKKNALTEEQAEAKFNDWLKEKEAKIQAKIDRLEKDRQTHSINRLEAEMKVNEKRVAEQAKKNAKEALANQEDEAAKSDKTATAQAESTTNMSDTRPKDDTKEDQPVVEAESKEKPKVKAKVTKGKPKSDEPVEDSNSEVKTEA